MGKSAGVGSQPQGGVSSGAKKAKPRDYSAAKRFTRLTDEDIHLFRQGSHFQLHKRLGAHTVQTESLSGTYFAVWAPHAESVSVIGSFNSWEAGKDPLRARADSGIWEGLIENVGPGALYKYHIVSRSNGYEVDKADPFAVHNEEPPGTASIVWNLDYSWGDQQWMKGRLQRNRLESPIAIYEVHAGSWMRESEAENRPLSYRELAVRLADYIAGMGFTHVEFLPIMEHPFGGSWGYQITGYFAPTSRFGSPQDLMYLIDSLHRRGIGVILDWVPSHFSSDEHGLSFFDGTHLFEYEDPRQGIHPEWTSCVFNYGRKEVCSFLASSAFFWLERYHADGLRFDAVSSMLYLDHSRNEGEWIPNEYGGRENLQAINFLRGLNEQVRRDYPDVHTCAEEATSWPMVSRPSCLGGLGFGMKWDMGWVRDTLDYMSKDPADRKQHHSNLTFRMLYAFDENFLLPLSHDEVAEGKGSLLGRMPGNEWERFAGLRTLLGYMYAQPAKKLLFMGGELGQLAEWADDGSLEWHLRELDSHSGLQRWVKDLNRLYRTEPALQNDFHSSGFEWIDSSDSQRSVISFLRKSDNTRELILVLCNFAAACYQRYRVGVPREGPWEEILNSDAGEYCGTGQAGKGDLEAATVPSHGHPYSLEATLPALTIAFFKSRAEQPPRPDYA